MDNPNRAFGRGNGPGLPPYDPRRERQQAPPPRQERGRPQYDQHHHQQRAPVDYRQGRPSNPSRSRSRSRHGQYGGGRSDSSWTAEDRDQVQRSGIMVKTNAWRVLIKQQRQLVWHTYRIDIFPVMRRQKIDVPGTYFLQKILLPSQHDSNDDDDDDDMDDDYDSAPEYKVIDNTARSPLTQQISAALAQQEPRLLTDGSEIALSMEDLFHGQPNNHKEYEIELPHNSSMTDLEAPYLGTRWWLVEVTRLDNQQVQLQMDQHMSRLMSDRLQQIEQYMSIALRSAMLHLPAFGKNPPHSFLPMPLQFRPDMFGFRVRPAHAPVVPQPALAIRATASVTQDNSLLVKANVLLNHILPDRSEPSPMPRHLKGRIPLLDPNASTLAGINVRLDQVVPEQGDIREKIANQLKRVVLEIRYQRSLKEGGWAKKMNEEGKTSEWLEKNEWFIRKKRKAYKQEPSSMIEWNPAVYTFTWHDRDITVEDYYREYYGVRLKYPKMPLIRVSNVERFPCEFLFQGSSASTIDSDIKTDDCLKFCDAFQGQERLSQIERVSKESGLLQGRDDDSMGTLERAFDKLGLRLKATQTKFKAEVLAQPKLNGDAQIDVNDGIWNMRRSKFHRGSRIHSFSVLRLSPSSIGHNDIESFLRSFESMWKKYGAQTSFSMSDHMESNIVDLDRARASPYSLDNAAQENQQKCWQSFYGGGTGIALVRRNWGKAGEIETVRECLLRPNPNDSSEYLALPIDKKRFVTRAENWGESIFPTNMNESNIRNIKWKRAGLTKTFCLENEHKKETVIVKALRFEHYDSKKPVGVLSYEEWPSVSKEQIAHPTIVFVLCTENLGSRVYNECKWAYEKRGIQTQIIRIDTFKTSVQRYRNPDMNSHLSGLALKVNGKVSNPIDRATNWSVFEMEAKAADNQMAAYQNILIIGYSMNSSQGKSGSMVVCGSCLVDCMRFGFSAMAQEKDTVVAGTLMERMTRNLYQQWLNENPGRCPGRVLVYRNSGNDGHFKGIIDIEVASIRKAIRSFAPDEPESVPLPITFVVSQSNHNMVIAPAKESHHQMNVPSGTSLRDPSILPQTHNFQGTVNGMDFFLTPQQGLKGTSKPILYRCLVNDDFSRDYNLDMNSLRRTTYLLSFQYGTASTAIRDVALLRYSHRQGSRMLSVLERMVDPSSDEFREIDREVDGATGKFIYCRRKEAGSPVHFDFLSGGGQSRVYSNLAM